MDLSVADDLTAFAIPAISIFVDTLKRIARNRSLTGLALLDAVPGQSQSQLVANR
jgi:predicted DNA-binding ribbon-helix-helix protein